MAFDVESGASGAAAGSALGPYGAAAGFVIGGFLGGKSKNKAKRERRQLQDEIRRISSPENYLRTVRMLTPKFREQIAATLAPALQGSVASNLARRNLTGTGVGEAVRNLGQVVPGVEANRMATQTAGDIIRQQLNALTGFQGYPVQQGAPPVSLEGGTDIAKIAALFRALNGGVKQQGTVAERPYVGLPDRSTLPPSEEPPLFPFISGEPTITRRDIYGSR